MTTPITWQDSHALGQAEMDSIHQGFVELLARAQSAADAELGAAMEALYSHTQSHFARETELMTATALSSRKEHEGDHARVLGEMDQMRARAVKGRVAFVRGYVNEVLPGWLHTHLMTMDAELANACKRAGIGAA